MNKKGFTLIELLVVVAIIAILAVIGITVFTGIQKNARDAKRKADVDSIINALEANYVSATGTYPTSIADNYFTQGTKPKDPSNGTSDYILNWSGTAGSSIPCVCAPVAQENTGTGTFTTSACASTGTVYYCKKGSQN